MITYSDGTEVKLGDQIDTGSGRTAKVEHIVETDAEMTAHAVEKSGVFLGGEPLGFWFQENNSIEWLNVISLIARETEQSSDSSSYQNKPSDRLSPSARRLAESFANPDLNALEKLQEWYLSNCNGEWEHMFGVKIETLDNPGWHVEIRLEGTPLEHINFEETKYRIDDNLNWYDCSRKDKLWRGAGGPQMLEDMLKVFLRWAESAEESSRRET